jgi:hypothetical protein
MGLLDDAIREHLDLKRRRGADPTEVEREEREVLGPVRQRVEDAGADEHELDQLPSEEHEPLAHDEHLAWANGSSEHAVSGDRPPAADTAFEHDQLAESGQAPAPYPDAAREPEPYPAAGHEPPDAGQTTVEYNIEDAVEAEDHPPAEGEEEDVLEETPEFLQDTPDHDRLWFEQRPPRDFDFDG